MARKPDQPGQSLEAEPELVHDNRRDTGCKYSFLAQCVKATSQALMPYLVKLIDFPGLLPEAQADAENRFRRALDRQLGEDVMPVWEAFQDASDSSATDLSKDDIAMAIRWPKAYDAAKTAGFRDLGTADGAYFELRAA